jgi:hypothetical protein
MFSIGWRGGSVDAAAQRLTRLAKLQVDRCTQANTTHSLGAVLLGSAAVQVSGYISMRSGYITAGCEVEMTQPHSA